MEMDFKWLGLQDEEMVDVENKEKSRAEKRLLFIYPPFFPAAPTLSGWAVASHSSFFLNTKRVEKRVGVSSNWARTKERGDLKTFPKEPIRLSRERMKR